MATANPTFLGLPQELRDEIYRHLLVSGVSIKCCPVRYNRYTREPPIILLPTNILQVGREIHYEAQEIMLKENTFIIDYRGLSHDYKSAQDLHSQEILKQASNLHIVVDDNVKRVFKVAKFLEFQKSVKSLRLDFRLKRRAYLGLNKFGEKWLEPLQYALDVLKKVAIRDVKVINSTNAQVFFMFPRRVMSGVKVIEVFTKNLETEMRKSYFG